MSTAGTTPSSTTGTDDNAKGNKKPTSGVMDKINEKPVANPSDGLGGITDSVKMSEVEGSLKVHIKLNLDVDIRVIAKIRGDIAIGIL